MILSAFVLLVALSTPGAAVSQDVEVRAYLSPGNTAPVGGQFVLNLEIQGSQALDQDPEVPDLTAFAQYLGSGTSTSMQIVGGRTTVSLTIQYRFQALEEGAFEIGAIEVAAAGQTFRTQPLEITVSAAPTPTQGGAPGTPSETGVASTDLFVTAEASRTRVREGEPFTVEYRIWTRVDVSSYNLTRVPEPEGFWVEDVGQVTQPQVEQVVRDGQAYATAVIRRVALVPTGPGERILDPLGIEAQVRVRRRGADPFEDLFGRSSLFGTTVVPTSVLSNPLTIEVEPLPPGRPEPFSGVVGRLDISAELDRDSVEANDAVTLTVRVSGQGNLRGVPAPELGLPSDFEAFPPEVSESMRLSGSGLSGSKTFEYVLIPRAPGTRSIPSIEMGFFDTGSEAYRTARTGTLDLRVTGAVAEGPAAMARGGVTQLREDIRFIHLGSGGLRPAHRFLFGEAVFWMFVLLPMAGVLGALGLRRHQDRLEGDVAYARGRRAGRVARKRFAEARRLAGRNDARAFYAEVARALRGLVADRLNLPEAGMQLSELGAGLMRHGVSESTVGDVLECLEHCDRQRFAPPGVDEEERTRFLDRASAVMTRLHREVR
jgi:hypothetical protein